MTGDIDATGGIVTGALLARAVEPHGDGAPHGAHTGLCLNCGTRLIGAHCHACGQAEHVHRSLGAIGHDIAHGVFHFEGRIWRTLPMLVARPGELTRRYIAGERARFVSPLALFLFTVFLMFALYSWVGPGDLAATIGGGITQTQKGLATGEAKTIAALSQLRSERAALVARGGDTRRIDRRIAGQTEDLDTMRTATSRLATGNGDLALHTGWTWLDHGVAKARENPGLVAYKVQSSGYKFSWALILISVPFVALLFLWRRGFSLYDHAIFVTYSISFMSLLVIALELGLAAGITTDLFWLVVCLAPPIHLYKQLRGAYGLSRFSAAWRLVFLSIFASIALLLFILGLVAMGISH